MADGGDSRQEAESRKWNRNVLATFAYRCSYALSMGLWNFGNGSTYIFLLENRSSQVTSIVRGTMQQRGCCLARISFPADMHNAKHHLAAASIGRLSCILASRGRSRSFA